MNSRSRIDWPGDLRKTAAFSVCTVKLYVIVIKSIRSQQRAADGRSEGFFETVADGSRRLRRPVAMVKAPDTGSESNKNITGKPRNVDPVPPATIFCGPTVNAIADAIIWACRTRLSWISPRRTAPPKRRATVDADRARTASGSALNVGPAEKVFCTAILRCDIPS